MCEYWLFSCTHETKSQCRAYNPDAKKPVDPEPLNVAFGTGQGYYSGSQGVGRSLPPPPPMPKSNPGGKINAVQVYTQQKAGVDTQLLTLATSQVCYGYPEKPKSTEWICYDCLLKEGREKQRNELNSFQNAATRAGVRVGAASNQGRTTLGSNLSYNAAQVTGNNHSGIIARHSLNDGGARLQGAKHGRGVTILGVGPPPQLTYTPLQ